VHLIFIGRYTVKQNGGRAQMFSEAISRYACVQSHYVALEGSCQSMVYRSMVLFNTLCFIHCV